MLEDFVKLEIGAGETEAVGGNHGSDMLSHERNKILWKVAGFHRAGTRQAKVFLN